MPPPTGLAWLRASSRTIEDPLLLSTERCVRNEGYGGAVNSAERVTETDAAPEDESRLSSIHTKHPDSSEPGRDVRRFISS